MWAGSSITSKDLEKVRRLLKEAGYQGEPVRYMVPLEVTDEYRSTLMIKQQLEEVGFVIDLQVVNWATLVQRRNNPDLWDAYTSGAVAFQPDPTLYLWMRCVVQAGWTCDPNFEKLLQAMATELQFERRYRLWQDLHRLFWERVPVIHYG